jgi:hypothetical protein
MTDIDQKKNNGTNNDQQHYAQKTKDSTKRSLLKAKN